ncbi:MAG: hypothetical protein ACK4N5_01340, partial [Myxococcales bacterium]
PRLARRRWENFELRLGEAAGKLWLLTMPGATLATEAGLEPGAPAFEWRQRTFERAFQSGGFSVYRER